ncbi:MAG: c-type cytochrome [Pseudomonadales bacterium]
MNTRSTKFCALIVSVPALVFLFAWAIHRMAPESAPVARGAAYAEVRGCVDCHGNPENPQADANDKACSNVNTMAWHPEYSVECTDVMAYFEVIRLRRNFDDRAQVNINSSLTAGEQLARKYHCFQCHGQLGQGGFENPKSLKGYVPGYFGADFKILTRNVDRESVRQWIMYGLDSTILEYPVTGRLAALFLRRQEVSMPSYQSLEPEEIDILVNYVIALNQFGPMTAENVRLYGESSRSTESLVSIGSGIRPKPLQPTNALR